MIQFVKLRYKIWAECLWEVTEMLTIIFLMAWLWGFYAVAFLDRR